MSWHLRVCALLSVMAMVAFGSTGSAHHLSTGRDIVEITQDPPVPTADMIIQQLRHYHPRLLVENLETFNHIRQQIDSNPLLGGWFITIRKRADRMLDEEPSKYEIPDGKRLLATSRCVADRVYMLAFTYRITDDRRYLDRVWTELESAAQFKDWNPSHFLDTAEMTNAFAIGYDWLYHDWSEHQRTVIRGAIMKHGLRPALNCYRGKKGYGWWIRSHHNWNQVCNGGIALGALAIGDEEPEIAGEILHKGLISLQRAMRTYEPDGACVEGPGYWAYATAYNILHLAALDSALGANFGYSTYPGFDRTGDFPIHMLGPTGKTFNFADGGDRLIRAPHLFWFAKRFDRPHWAWYEQQVAGPHVLDLLWYTDAGEKFDVNSVPLDKYFKRSETVTMRSAWEDTEALFIGFKAGSNAVNHANLDLGSFVFDAFGVRWIIDPGADNYNLPGYFGSKRWTYYRLRAEGHNTLVLNPSKQPDQNPKASTKIIRFDSTPDRVFAIADLTPTYSDHAQKVHRGIAMINQRRAVLIQDEIKIDSAEPVDLWWFAHTRATIQIDADNPSQAVLSSEGTNAQLVVRILEPVDAKFLSTEAHPLPTSPNPKGQNVNKGIRKLAIHLPDVTGEFRIVVLMTPFQSGPVDASEKSVEVIPMESW